MPPRVAQPRLQVIVLILVLALVALALASKHAIAGSKIVRFKHDYPHGSIVIVNNQRKLYYVLGNGRAIRYPVAVGERKELWTGKISVHEKRKNPTWRHPDGTRVVEGGVRGNPLGVRAIYLGWTLWRIHGTSNPGSIGGAVSNGCIRMYNRDVSDLYDRVHIGAPVYAINSLRKGGKPRHRAKKLIEQ